MTLSENKKTIIRMMQTTNLPFRYNTIVKKGRLSKKDLEEMLMDRIITRVTWGYQASATYSLTDLGKSINLS